MSNIRKTPYKIGITGTVASGKSLVGNILQKEGVVVLDADCVVSRLYEEDISLRANLFRTFGTEIRTVEGTVDKPVLRKMVFNDPDKLRILEELVHPKVSARIERFLKDENPPHPSPLPHWGRGSRCSPHLTLFPNGEGSIRAVLVPLLFEAGTETIYDETWVVTVKLDILLERLQKRDKISADEAQKLLSAQWPQDLKAAKADRIIDNSGTPEETETEVLKILNNLREKLSK